MKTFRTQIDYDTAAVIMWYDMQARDYVTRELQFNI